MRAQLRALPDELCKALSHLRGRLQQGIANREQNRAGVIGQLFDRRAASDGRAMSEAVAAECRRLHRRLEPRWRYGGYGAEPAIPFPLGHWAL